MLPTSFADTLYALGHWLMNDRRLEDAAHIYRTMLTTVPSDERGWLGLAYTHEERGDNEVARSIYLLAEGAVPTSFRMPLARARLERRAGNDVATDAGYQRAAELARYTGEDEAAASIEHEWSHQ